MIIIGSDVVIGSRAMEAVDIRSDKIEQQEIIVTTKIGDNKTIAISIAAAQNNIFLPHRDVLAIRFHPHSEVNVDNGVYKGKTVLCINGVTSFSKLGTWHGEGSWKTTYSL